MVHHQVSDDEASAKAGVYPVYLFAEDGSSVYLSLNQGTDELKGGVSPLRKRALDIRSVLGTPHELATTLDLASANTRPARYAAANIYARKYTSGAIPYDENLKQDLRTFLGFSRQVRNAGFDFNAEFEPQHLLLKWSSSREPNTIAKHVEIAKLKGSVWWGRMAKPGIPSMGDKKYKELTSEIESGIVTFAILYRLGETWRAQVKQIERDGASVDEDRFPSYYSKQDCTIFFRLSDFEQLPSDWAEQNVLLAFDPDPVKVKGALSNDTSPLFVYLRQLREPVKERVIPERPTLTIDWIARETLLDPEQVNEMLEILTGDQPQIILAGPPGTGKTWIATHLASYLVQGDDDRKKLVQFHPTYGYEQFVEGLQPKVSEGTLTFAPVKGALLHLLEGVVEGSPTRVMIVDEMNRANLPRVFGELMYLLEYRDAPIDLLLRANFRLPKSLILIGTMNTADKSIRSIDIALRRRFEIFECRPDVNILKKYYETATSEVPNLYEGFVNLNADLADQLDRHHEIGHTFFMRQVFTRRDLERMWKRKLLPLIEQYFFDSSDVAAGFTMEKYWPKTATDAA